jgi:hypothetical protein
MIVGAATTAADVTHVVNQNANVTAIITLKTTTISKNTTATTVHPNTKTKAP